MKMASVPKDVELDALPNIPILNTQPTPEPPIKPSCAETLGYALCKDRVSNFVRALFFGPRTKRTLRVLLSLIPIYLLYIFLPPEINRNIMPFALVEQFIAIGYLVPKTLGASCLLETSVFIGVLIGIINSTYLLAICVAGNVYITYALTILCVALSEPLFTQGSLHPFLGLFPWIVVDSIMISYLETILQQESVDYVAKLWTGGWDDARLLNMLISNCLCLGVGILAYMVPPVSLEFTQLYLGASGLLSNLSKQFETLSAAFRGPVKEDSIALPMEDSDSDPSPCRKVQFLEDQDVGQWEEEVPDLVQEPEKVFVNDSNVLDSLEQPGCTFQHANEMDRLERKDHSVLVQFKSLHSLHYERALAQLKTSSESFAKTRYKATRMIITVGAAKAEFPLRAPYPLPKVPFSDFAHTCDVALWRTFLIIIRRYNRDSYGFSEHNKFIMSACTLDEGFLQLIADVLACDSRILEILSEAIKVLTNPNPREISDSLTRIYVDLLFAQENQRSCTDLLSEQLQIAHKKSMLERKMLLLDPQHENALKVAIHARLFKLHELQSQRLMDPSYIPKEPVLDSVLKHYYESSAVAFLALLGGTRLNGETSSLTSLTKEICNKSMNRTWEEGVKAVTDPFGMVLAQVITEYIRWFKLMYSGLVPFTWSSSRSSFAKYWKSARGRHFLREVIGLAILYAPSMFSHTYRSLFNLNELGQFGAWQIHAFVSSLQVCAEATTKKVFWRLIGNTLGGLVGFLVLYISRNPVFLSMYLVVVTSVTTWMLNGTTDTYFDFTIEFGYALNAFGVVGHILVGNSHLSETTRELAIYTASRVLAQIVGTLLALVISLVVFPTFAYDHARDLIFTGVNNLMDKVANTSVEIYLGFADFPLDLKSEFDSCEKCLHDNMNVFQLARKDVESAEKYGTVKYLGIWFYDGGEAVRLLDWTNSVLTCMEGMLYLTLRPYSYAMGAFGSDGCLLRPDSALVESKIPEHSQLCLRFTEAMRERFSVVVEMVKFYSMNADRFRQRKRKVWKLKWVRRNIDEENDIYERDDLEEEIKELGLKLLNKQYEFWLAYFELERVFLPQISDEEFEKWYSDFYRLDAFTGFLRRLEDLMVEFPSLVEGIRVRRK